MYAQKRPYDAHGRMLNQFLAYSFPYKFLKNALTNLQAAYVILDD